MNIRSVKLVYFSPTGTTKKTLEGIAEGIGSDSVEHVNLTAPDAVEKAPVSFSDELVLIGSPVYAGRLPVDAVERLKRVRGNNTPAVLVVTYGNRAYEDALLELSHVAKELGFVPLSAAAFIGEHSFHTHDMPIAEGRPDNRDIDRANAYGTAIREKMAGLRSVQDTAHLEIPGNYPYKEDMGSFPGGPVTSADLCEACGTCAAACPKNAITVSEIADTDEQTCIKCCACVKVCPVSARSMDLPFIKKIAAWLHENYAERKEPETFL
jgi:ferredoxin